MATGRETKCVSALQRACSDAIALNVPLHADALDIITGDAVSLKASVFYKYFNSPFEEADGLTSRLSRIRKPARFAILVKRHWVAAELSRTAFVIMDSAPHSLVRQEIDNMATALKLPQPEYLVVPTQARGSNECGLFAAMYIHARAESVQIPSTTQCISLRHLVGAMHSAESFAVAALETLRKVQAPLGGAEPLTNADIRHVLEDAAEGSRVEYTFYHSPLSEQVHVWYGTVKSVSGTERRRKWLIEWDRMGEDMEDMDYVAQCGYLPATVENDNNLVNLAVRLFDKDVGSEPAPITDNVVRDYEEPADTADIQPDRWHKRTSEGPTTELVTGADFMRWTLLSFEEAAARSQRMVPWAAVTLGVRRGHVAELAKLATYIIDTGCQEIHLQLTIAAYLQARRTSRSTPQAWSTVKRLLGSLIGAFAAAPYYFRTAPSLDILKWPVIADFNTAVNRLSARDGTREPPPASPQDVRRTIDLLNDDEQLDAASLLALCWYTCQRPCDVLLVLTENLTKVSQTGFRMKLREGKTIGRVQPYHIHFKITSTDAREHVENLISRRRRHKRLFSFANAYQRSKILTTLRTYLRNVNSTLELRSLRRGSLQTLAKSVEEKDLLAYSRHRSIDTLRLYLGNEAVETPEHRRIMAQSDSLDDDAGGEYPPSDKGREMPYSSFATLVNDGIAISSDHPPPSIATISKQEIEKWPLHIKAVTKEPCCLNELDRLASTCPGIE